MKYQFTLQPSQSEPAQGDASGEILIPKRYAFATIGGLVLFGLLFISGVHTRGYESKTVRFANFSKVSSGHSMGSKRVFLRAGQTFAIDYETEIEHGHLYISLSEFWSPLNTPATGEVRVRQSGSGQLHVAIPKTGVYRLWIRGSPDSNGYALSYDVSWKAT